VEAKVFPVVIVTWVDAATENGWTDTDEAHDFVPPQCLTLGYLVADKPDHLVLAQSHGGDEMGNRWTIPRGMVRDVRTLVVGEPYAPDKGENAKKNKRRTPKGR
jgi:hypothetical protein